MDETCAHNFLFPSDNPCLGELKTNLEYELIYSNSPGEVYSCPTHLRSNIEASVSRRGLPSAIRYLPTGNYCCKLLTGLLREISVSESKR